MTDRETFTGTYHVLLIGIDAYPRRPLRGAVNDIDAIQRWLLGPKVGLPASSIQRLASPHAGAVHDTTVPEKPATLANIRAALHELGTARVSSGDRVVIHYSGHGVRFTIPSGIRVFHREALVPVDCNDGNWLFDHELNELLRAITDRTRSVVFIVDACHSASIMRTGHFSPDPPPVLYGRCLEASEVAAVPAVPAGAPTGVSMRSGFGVEDCHVVAACLDHEEASESPGPDHVVHGVLTRALVETLNQLEGIDPRTAPWVRLWDILADRVECANRHQHVWSSGGLARAVLAGPPVPGDVGLEVRATGSGSYQIAPGTLAGVTVKARIALYGDRPARFPPLDSAEDHAARLPAVLEVVSAEPTTAVATGSPIALPARVRGRLVRFGVTDRLRVATLPRDRALEAALGGSGLLELADERSAEVCVARADDHWNVIDDVHRGTPDLPALVRIPVGAHMAHGLVCLVLEHYTRYRAPLRIAHRAVDLPGALGLELVKCPAHDIRAVEAQVADLPVIAMQRANACDVVAGARVAFRVDNRAERPLRVTLVNCAASGRVQLLGDQVIDPYSSHMFWANNNLGQPFAMMPPNRSQRCIDRLVVIGRTALDRSLDFLRVDHGFLDRGRNAVLPPPPEQWTATQMLIRTSAPGAPRLTSAPPSPPGCANGQA